MTDHDARQPGPAAPRRVSAIVPAFNYARYLPEAIDSILAQSRDDLEVEVIVVDDASADDTPAVLARYAGRVRAIRHARQSGSGAAANSGVRESTGEFLAFLDADDRWMPGKLARQVAAFDADPALDLVFGWVQEFVSPDYARAASPDVVPRRQPAPIAGTMLVRREAYRRAGEFAEGGVLGEFLAWYLRASELALKSVMLPEVLLERRVHADNLTRRDRAARRDYVRVLKHAIDRRRAQAASGAPVREER